MHYDNCHKLNQVYHHSFSDRNVSSTFLTAMYKDHSSASASRANLWGANLRGRLSETNLQGATLWGETVSFEELLLANVIQLDAD